MFEIRVSAEDPILFKTCSIFTTVSLSLPFHFQYIFAYVSKAAKHKSGRQK